MRCPWTFRCSQAEAGVPALSQISKGLRIVVLTPLTENKSSQSRKLFLPPEMLSANILKNVLIVDNRKT